MTIPATLAVFDTETTGVSVSSDRILTCYMAEYTPDMKVLWEESWTIDPGVEVPEGASNVHGMTTEWIREHGRKDAKHAIMEILLKLEQFARIGVPIAAFNLPFDLTILHHEAIRHGLPEGVNRELLRNGVFYDALVHDKGRDKYRKGKRKLQNICEHNSIEFSEEAAHEASYDVLKTAELSFCLLRKERKLGVADLMPLLVEWKQEQNLSLEAYWADKCKRNANGEAIITSKGWPLITEEGN